MLLVTTLLPPTIDYYRVFVHPSIMEIKSWCSGDVLCISQNGKEILTLLTSSNDDCSPHSILLSKITCDNLSCGEGDKVEVTRLSHEVCPLRKITVRPYKCEYGSGEIMFDCLERSLHDFMKDRKLVPISTGILIIFY